MKTKRPLFNLPGLLAGVLLACTLRLPAQSPPVITTQPAGQTNLAGTTANFNVAVSGPGPFTYQWQLNGTNLPIGIISTVAGNGNQGYAGDGGAATSASLNNPYGLAVDAANNLYVADSANNRIRKVDTNGVITTVAGTGTGTYTGDGGPATNASLSSPQGVALDAMGNLYIADTANNRIRQVDTNGIITTVAGNGTGTYAGDGGAATNASLASPYALAWDAAGNCYIADAGNNRIRQVDTNGVIITVAGNGAGTYAGDGGAATNASLWSPQDLALDPVGNLDVADTYNNVIRQVAPNGVITTIAVTNANLDYPAAIALDAAGDLYIADFNNNRIREVPTNGLCTTMAGNGNTGFSGDGGMAVQAALFYPTGVAFDLSGSLYLASSGNGYIRKVYLDGTPALTLNNVGVANAGNYTVVIANAYGSVTSAPASLIVYVPTVIQTQPASQTVPAGTSPVLSVTATGTLPLDYSWYLAGTNLVQTSTNNTLRLSDVAMNEAGSYTVVITNSFLSVTSQVATLTVVLPPTVAAQPTSQTNLTGTTVSFTVTPGGTGPFTYHWQLNGTNLPNGITSTVAGNGTAAYAGDGGQATNASLYYPSGVTVDAAGNLYIADTDNQRIRKVNTNGIITTVAGKGNAAYGGNGGAATNASLYYPAGVALDLMGNLYIADQYNYCIRMVNTNGFITTIAGNGVWGSSGDGGTATSASLDYPAAIALDAAGNLYIADTDNQRIRMVNTNGIITTVAGTGTAAYGGDGGAATNACLYYPNGVALDAFDNLYIADYRNNRIRLVTTNGLITTVAGKSNAGYSGDGGAATNAGLNLPAGVALDTFGNLYIADYQNDLIRLVATNGVISTVATTNTSLYYPTAVALDVSGNLYIADKNNQRIRKVLRYAGYPTFTLGQISANNAGNYSVIISSAYGSVTSMVATLTVLSPPAIAVQPASHLAAVGGNTSFSVTATGTPPFGYSWYFNVTNLLQIGANSTLTLANLTTNAAGNYTVVITNNYGSMTSQVAILTVGYPPWVAVQPSGQTNLAGTTASFTVTPGGPGPFNYQWQFNGANLPATLNLITTVAGNGQETFAGDGGAATNASLNYPIGMTLDALGNLYIPDSSNNCVRKVDTNGFITTVAGKSAAGFSGDGGAATNAGLNFPESLAFDAAGNYYVADTGNNRIRKVATNGLITTVAGNGNYGYSGDGGKATNASFYEPTGVTFDFSGNLYIADWLNNRIRKVATNGLISTVTGNGTGAYAGDGGVATRASLDEPTRMSLDAAGNLYFADSGNQCVRKVSTNGIITTVAGKSTHGFSGDGGAATNACLEWPAGVALDAAHNLYIADNFNNRIRRVDTNGVITTVAGDSLTSGRFSGSYSGDGGAPTNASLYAPNAMAFDATGNLLFADSGNNRIRKLWLCGLNPTLTFGPVSANNAGNYCVVISNPYGSVTSAVVSLTVAIPTNPPQIISSGTNFGLLTNQFGFNLNAAYGQTIVVDGSTNLLDWTPLFTNTANGSPFYFYDPAWTNFPWRFYRARLP